MWFVKLILCYVYLKYYLYPYCHLCIPIVICAFLLSFRIPLYPFCHSGALCIPFCIYVVILDLFVSLFVSMLSFQSKWDACQPNKDTYQKSTIALSYSLAIMALSNPHMQNMRCVFMSILITKSTKWS